MSGGRKLARSVFVRAEGTEGRWYHAGETVPASEAKSITNPNVWEKDSDGETEDREVAKAPAKKATRSSATGE